MAVAAIAGLTLLYLVVPRTIGAFLALPGNHILQSVRHGEAVDDQALEALAASRRRAAGWMESGRLWSDLALAEFLLADRGDAGGGVNLDRVRQASESLHVALGLAPANPHAWTRRAYAEMLLNGPSEAAASALAMSMLTGRYEPDLMFARLELCLAAWRHFSDEDRELVLDQTRLAWRKSPGRLVDLAAEAGRMGIVRAALAAGPADLAELKRRLAARGAGSGGN